MLPTAEERIPALANGEEIFSWAAGVALAALDTHQGAREAQGKKPHQGIFSKNRALRVGEIWAKYSGTHQVRNCSWSETVSGTALDANGNTLSDASGKQYTWDFENRLVQAVVPGTNGGTTTFRYDLFGRRIQKSGPLGTTNYLYDGPNLAEELDASGNVLARYTQDLGVDEPFAEIRSGTTSYYASDGLGSITSLTNPSATITGTYGYDSLGNLVSSTGSLVNPFRNTAREFDSESSLYYYRARYFDPTTGRFLSEDPIAFEGGANFYAYVGNNVPNLIDPFGLCVPSADIAKCLENAFGQPIDKVTIIEKVKPADYKWGATTRKNEITIFVPCDVFFNDPDTYLEEYYHVLEQWNTGRLSRLKYAWEYVRHGYDNNKYENEAKDWVKRHRDDFKKCLSCQQSK
jgi:RHS repeat-associated protein